LKTIAVAFSAISGAVLGFIAGLYFAYLAGLHEKLHVFGLALPSAAVVSLLAAAGTSHLFTQSRRFRALILFICAGSAASLVAWFLHIIKAV
jgi:ABC-type dipeptide/oligopeptide/nickel transport system permease subunit